MKSTKRIFSAFLTLCMLLSCVAVGFTAQAASFPTEITSDFTWNGGNVTLDSSVRIINESAEPIKVDLGNATITGPDGKTVVNIIGNVEVYNGTFIATVGDYSGETGFVKALADYKPAITIFEGDVVLDCVTAVGSLIRVPNSSSVEITAGNGIAAMDGNLTLRHVIACGLKALDNTYAAVTVEDAILVGLYKAINAYGRVAFADGYVQYETVDFLKGLLKDGKSLSAKEEEILTSLTNSQGDASIASVVANVKAPAYADLTHTYADGTLKVYAQADLAGTVAGVANRYSYQYTPAACTIDGNTVDFVADENGAYVATFDGVEDDAVYDVTADYDLSVKLGKKQKDVLVNAIDSIAAYADRAPELVGRFVDDFESLYDLAMSYVVLFYNARTASATKSFFENDESMMQLYSIILALVGENFEGFGGVSSTSRYAYWSSVTQVKRFLAQGKYEEAAAFAAYYDNKTFKPLFEGTLNSSVYGEVNGSIYYKRNADFSGVGIIEQFDKYYSDVMALLYKDDSKTEWNDPAAAAKYIGDNWEEMYELVEAAIVLVNAAVEVIDDESLGGKLQQILGTGSLDDYVAVVRKAAGYLDTIVAKVEEFKNSDFVAQYGSKAGDYCAEYTEKALYILDNINDYFALDVEGDFINLSKAPFDYTQSQTIKVAPAVTEKQVRVNVSVTGGVATLNGATISTEGYAYYNIGDDVVINAAGDNFSHMVIVSGSELIYNSDTYAFKAATNIEIKVIFRTAIQEALGASTVTYMTDKALNYKYIASTEYTDDTIADLEFDIEDVVAPGFTGLTLEGWALDKNSEAPVEIDELVDEITVAAESGNVFVYAIYDYEETVIVPTQKEAVTIITATDNKGFAYFETFIQVPEGYTAIEGGLIATKNSAYATEDNMTTALSGAADVRLSRATGEDVTDANGNLLQYVLWKTEVTSKNAGTVYARGYVVLLDADGNEKILYSDIATAEIL